MKRYSFVKIYICSTRTGKEDNVELFCTFKKAKCCVIQLLVVYTGVGKRGIITFQVVGHMLIKHNAVFTYARFSGNHDANNKNQTSKSYWGTNTVCMIQIIV